MKFQTLSTGREQHRAAAQRLRGWRWHAMGLAVALLGIGAPQPREVVEQVMAAQVVHSGLSTHRDPNDLGSSLHVILPRPVLPLTQQDAIAHVLLQESRTLSEAEALAVAQALVEEGEALGQDPLLFLALIRVESNYNHLALSPVGAEGLMQLMPPTAKWMAERTDTEWPEFHTFDPVLNVRLGARYLSHLGRRYDGRMDLALTAYNRGPHNTGAILRRNGRLPASIRAFYSAKVFAKHRALKEAYGHLPLR